jgi:hypothetical protein
MDTSDWDESATDLRGCAHLALAAAVVVIGFLAAGVFFLMGIVRSWTGALEPTSRAEALCSKEGLSWGTPESAACVEGRVDDGFFVTGLPWFGFGIAALFLMVVVLVLSARSSLTRSEIP